MHSIRGLLSFRTSRAIALGAILLLGLAGCSGGNGSSSSTAIDNSGDSGLNVTNVTHGQVFSKGEDADPDSELLDIILEITGTDVPDGSDIVVKVQGTVTVGGRIEPAIYRQHVVMNQNLCSADIILFPDDNTISLFLLPENAIEGNQALRTGDRDPSLTLSVTSSHQSVGDDLSELISEDQYNQITANARDNASCVEANRSALGLPDTINGQWYYTYENFINAMRKVPKFAGEGDLNTRKLEIAAIFANVAQETGSGGPNGAGCAIQEGYGSARESSAYGGLAPTGAGYCGRGPLQLSWDYNYKSFGADMGLGDDYLNDPDILTKEPTAGLAGSMWFWNHKEPQWNGSVAPPFKPAAHDVMIHSWDPTTNDTAAGRIPDRDFGVVINIVNGGIECGQGGSGTAQANNRVNYYPAMAAILGAVIPDTQTDEDLNCANQGTFNTCPSSVAYPPCQ